MKKTPTALDNELRAKYKTLIETLLEAAGEEILTIASNAIAFPVVDAESNEKFIKITISVPKGDRDGTPYDGYADATDYQFKQEQAKVTAAKRTIKAKK